MKKNFLVLVAIILGIGLSAFSTEDNANPNNLDFYLFIGEPDTDDETKPEMYVLDSDPGCNGSQIRCGVYANPGSGNHPNLTSGFTFVDRNP